MTKNAEFERCVNFLARMIEKYGNEIALPNEADTDKIIYKEIDNANNNLKSA